ncbi:phosphonate ABC transporter, periplasmic phosphonate binding protein [Desulfovibrio sp. X2]|uniref:phosphonate ABC transporter substrate-binding protein n=1 Tax=Desulfovibrio sp. X2 TaxID=941449 RepID=UPI000358F01B|nr:phosphonate ABC transporter substrate-binding protein [Desulfovibrio sp. X2]EPR43827.1 phosphonate ABC transporter, periplasmic phosphonate binding protein [Desulfovibrio sp. X2]
MIKRIMFLLTLVSVLAAAALPALAASPCKDWPTTVRMGVIPTEGAADTAKRFKPLTDHLQKVLGVPVEVYTASDYAGIITAMANKHIELAYFGPKSYVEASEKAGAQAVAMEVSTDGTPGYYGIIISKKGSGIKTMADAKGKTFAFTDPNSTSGFLVPNVLFARDMKVKPQDYFSEVRFSGSHGASMLAVKNGGIQVAATNTEDLARMEEKGALSPDDFNIIWKSDLIPGSPYAVRRDLPESFKAAFCGALMFYNSDKAGLEKLQIGGFVPADDTSYDIVRYLNKLKKELQKNN